MAEPVLTAIRTWLGSSRLVSSTGQTVRYDGAFSPFGVPYAPGGTSDASFTGMDQDIVANLDDFPAREYQKCGPLAFPRPGWVWLQWIQRSNRNRGIDMPMSSTVRVRWWILGPGKLNSTSHHSQPFLPASIKIVDALIELPISLVKERTRTGTRWLGPANFTMNSGAITPYLSQTAQSQPCCRTKLIPRVFDTSYVYVDQLSVGVQARRLHWERLLLMNSSA